MTLNQKKTSGRINRERILLASIPVIGSIIIAFFTTDKFSCNSNHNTQDNNQKRISLLKDKAGKANDMIVFGRYNDLLEMMSDGLKPVITKEVFKTVGDTISLTLGTFFETHRHYLYTSFWQ